MKWLIGLVVLLVIGSAVALYVVVADERDTVPGDIRACAQDAGARRVDGADSLGPLRVDLLRDTLAAEEQVELSNGYRATFLRPEDGSYVAVAVARPDQAGQPPLETVAQQPGWLPFVGYGEGDAGAALEACVDDER